MSNPQKSKTQSIFPLKKVISKAKKTSKTQNSDAKFKTDISKPPKKPVTFYEKSAQNSKKQKP
jgi:hypothetical protein